MRLFVIDAAYAQNENVHIRWEALTVYVGFCDQSALRLDGHAWNQSHKACDCFAFAVCV